MADVLQMPPREGDRSPAAPVDARAPTSADERERNIAADAEAREHALDVSASWIVEAPAGSGKTGLILQRYLKLLASPDVAEPEEVLAITFTRAATEEIRSRLLAELKGAALDSPAESPFARTTRALAQAALAHDRERGWALLDDPQRLRIRSIDSVCGEIARLLPVMSGGGAQVRPLEDASPLYHEAARRTLLLLGGVDRRLNDALRTLLLHRDGNLDRCESLLAEMLKAREQWGSLVPLDAESLTDEALERKTRPQLDRALDLAICAALTDLTHALPSGFLDRLARFAAELSDRPGHNDQLSPIALCGGSSNPPEALTAHLEHWRALAHLLLVPTTRSWRKGFNSNHVGFQSSREDKARLKGLIAELEERPEAHRALCAFACLPPARYPEEQWVVTKALLRVLQRALVELQLVFAASGECDFTEPALLARAALRHGEGADAYSAALGVELRHLLVDEVQDTSTGQYELLELLTAGWAGTGQTVFLVGDPKQSIYLFREARVERFLRTVREQRLGDLPVSSLRLSANFRSQSGLVRDLNHSFSRIFPAAGAQDDVIPYAPVHAARPEAPPREGELWHTATLDPPHVDRLAVTQHVLRAHASQIRELVTAWRRRPLPPGRSDHWKIAVLIASRSELRPIVAAFNRPETEGAVPFRAIKVEPLRERPEVLDLLALTRALRHPADRVAWWAVLRAPFCGFGLRDLHMLAGHDDPAFVQRTVLDLVRARGDRLSTSGRTRLERVWMALAPALEQVGRVPFPELVERTWYALGGDSYLDATALANSRQYLELMEELYRETGDLSLSRLNQKLDRLYAAPSQAEDAVDLMTIHGAKGLEWDVVIIPELEHRAPPGETRLLEWEELEQHDSHAATVMLAPIRGKGAESSALNTWLRGLRADRLRAERRRQFYVGATRAREQLHLFAAADRNKAGELRPAPHSLLEAAWPAAAEHFIAAATIEEPAAATPAVSAPAERLSLAAVAAEISTPPTYRVPAASLRVDLLASQAAPSQSPYLRPEGSFGARSLGNAVHAFLELAAAELQQGHTALELRSAAARWQPRIRAVLRADGIAPAQIGRLLPRVQTALDNTLRDPVGQWILGRRRDARSEHTLTLAQPRAQVRLDRLFRAGTAPLVEGDDVLWIIDYKTASHAVAGLEYWLEQEKRKYLAQMQAYARAFPGQRMQLGLWFPMIARLVWWNV